MKKITLLLFALILFSLTGIAQRITLSRSATIDLQKRLHKAQKGEITSLASRRFGKTKYLARTIQNSAGKVYMIDDIVVFVNSRSKEKQLKYLTRVKLAFDDTFKTDKSYSSKIETIGGKDVFTTDQLAEGLKMYRFLTVNKSEDFSVNGFVQYKTGDELKARTVLEDLIKGLRFE